MWKKSTILAVSLFATAAIAQPKQGLDALTDDRLMTELGMRGMTSLLDRAMDLNKVPANERSARRVPVLIARLNQSAALTPQQRQEQELRR